MDTLKKGLFSLIILLSLGNNCCHAYLQQGSGIHYFLQVNNAVGSFSSLGLNLEAPPINFAQHTIKEEKAIIDDFDGVEDDDEDKLVVGKKYVAASMHKCGISRQSLANVCYRCSAKRIPFYSKHFANASSCRLFIRNRAIRV
jgi:hypothetical protein